MFPEGTVRDPDRGFDIAFLVVNHNMGPLVEQCLQNLRPQLQEAGLRYEVLVGDNSRNPEFALTPDRCAAHPHTRHVACPLGGWIPVLNALIPLTRARHVCVLHPDVSFETDSIRRCIAHLDEHPEAGVVAPNSFRPDGSPSVVRLTGPSTGSELKRFLNFLLYFPLRSRPFHERPLWDHARDTEAASVLSFCYFVRGDLLRSLVPFGGDQETYFGNDDVCYSARQRGFKVRYLAAPRITHFERKTPRELYASSEMDYKTSAVQGSAGMQADELRFVRRHCSRATYLAIRSFMAMEFSLSVLVAWLKNRCRVNGACHTYARLLRLALSGPPEPRRG